MDFIKILIEESRKQDMILNTKPSVGIKHTGIYVYIKHNLQGHERIEGYILNIVWFVGERLGVEIRGK